MPKLQGLFVHSKRKWQVLFTAFLTLPGAWAADLVPGLITLDPICAPLLQGPAPLAPGNPAPGTVRMARRLAEIRERADPSSMAYLSDDVARLLAAAAARTTNLAERFRIQFELGVKQTEAGRPDQGLNTFAALETGMRETGLRLSARNQVELRMRKAVAYMRLGEQENCLATRNADSCLFPLQPKAYHLLPRGSRAAIALLSEQLENYPQDLTSRWLLNLAYMTLGEYPDKVPTPWLIPPSTFASEYNLPRFPDVGDQVGLDIHGLAGGTVVDDFDNDGLLDVFASSWSIRDQLRFFHNDGNGRFTERTSEAGLVGLTGGLQITQTDYNNDGRLDLLVLRGAWLGKAGRMPNSLLRNNGDGTFTDVTEEAGLLSFHPTQAAVWLDYDGDGWLDLFIGNESMDARDPDLCELYHNNGDGTFRECAVASGLRVDAFIKGVTSGDYDNDGRPDLYLSCRDGRNYLFHNDGAVAGAWRFSDVTKPAGVEQPIFSFPTWFFDYDNDGWEDIFVSGYGIRDVGEIAADYLGLPTKASKPKLYRNLHDGTFADVTEAVHLNRVCHTMGSNYGDLDNDGWLDFYLATGDPSFTTLVPNRMFRNDGGRVFQEVTTATGTGHIQKGHGVAFADMDNDGDQDVYVVMGGAFTGDTARNALFLNPGNTNHWLKLQLAGTKANRAAIGARVRVDLQTPNGPRQLHRTVSRGSSFGGNPLRLEVGLGDATAIASVEVRWPGSGTVQTFTGLEKDSAYAIREGDSSPQPIVARRVSMARPETARPGGIADGNATSLGKP